MTIRDRVTDVVQKWSKTTEFETTDSLLVLWNGSGQSASVPFQPNAVMRLITALSKEFQTMFDLSALIPDRFKPDGDIDTVDNLVDEVTFSPTVAGTHAMFAGFAHPAAEALLTKAVADEVERRLKPVQKKTSKTNKGAAKTAKVAKTKAVKKKGRARA